MNHSGSCPIREALHEACQVYGMERKIKEHEVLLRWEEIVGTAIANHATPKRFSNGKLWVSVDDANWRHQISLSRLALRDKINTALGMTIVDEVILR